MYPKSLVPLRERAGVSYAPCPDDSEISRPKPPSTWHFPSREAAKRDGALRQGKLLHVPLVAGLDVDLQRVEDADDGVVVGDDDRQFDEAFGVQVTA